MNGDLQIILTLLFILYIITVFGYPLLKGTNSFEIFTSNNSIQCL